MEREVYWHPSGAEEKNRWSYTSAPPVCLHGADRPFTFFYLLLSWIYPLHFLFTSWRGHTLYICCLPLAWTDPLYLLFTSGVDIPFTFFVYLWCGHTLYICCLYPLNLLFTSGVDISFTFVVYLWRGHTLYIFCLYPLNLLFTSGVDIPFTFVVYLWSRHTLYICCLPLAWTDPLHLLFSSECLNFWAISCLSWLFWPTFFVVWVQLTVEDSANTERWSTKPDHLHVADQCVVKFFFVNKSNYKSLPVKSSDSLNFSTVNHLWANAKFPTTASLQPRRLPL